MKNIRLWLISILLISAIGGASAYYVWKTLIVPFEVMEPLEVLDYPSQFSLYPGETLEFNVTVMNHASRNYTVILDFSLDNESYQESYVAFSAETYTVIPGQQNLTAWLEVEAHAPPINASLTIDFHRIAEGVGEELIFFDNFNDGVADGWTKHLGTWNVIDGEYRVSVVGLTEDGLSTVDILSLTDCAIETKLRFTDAVGFKTGIVFRYTDNEHYYTFELSNEYDCVQFIKYTPEKPGYGVGIATTGEGNYSVHRDTSYLLKVIIQGNTFRGFINGEEVLAGADESYVTGKVGLRARRAEVYFDNFTVYTTL